MRSLEVAIAIAIYSKLYKKSGSHLTVVAMHNGHTWDQSYPFVLCSLFRLFIL